MVLAGSLRCLGVSWPWADPGRPSPGWLICWLQECPFLQQVSPGCSHGPGRVPRELVDVRRAPWDLDLELAVSLLLYSVGHSTSRAELWLKGRGKRFYFSMRETEISLREECRYRDGKRIGGIFIIIFYHTAWSSCFWAFHEVDKKVLHLSGTRYMVVAIIFFPIIFHLFPMVKVTRFFTLKNWKVNVSVKKLKTQSS